MALFLLRDDDANATTDPHRFERTYAPLLDAGQRMVLSVIPNVTLDVRAPDGGPERFLREDVAGSQGHMDLHYFSPMARWLRTHRDQCSVAQHGFDHQRVRGGTEFGSLSYSEASERLDAGRKILTQALGTAPLGFVAPWDALSRGSLEAAVERFPVISTGWLNRERLPPVWWPAHALERVRRSETLCLGGCRLVRHRGGPIGASTNPADVPAILARLAQDAEVAVVVLHHWMFWSQSDPHPVITALAEALRGHRTIGLSSLVPHASRVGMGSVSRHDRAPEPVRRSS